MLIRKYEETDKLELYNALKEDPDWSIFTHNNNFDLYINLINNSYTIVIYEDNYFTGYLRAIIEEPFFVYINELYIKPAYRHHGYATKLINYVKKGFINYSIYVLSENDEFYEHLKYKKAGSIYQIK